MYNQPAAGPLQTGRMTVNDVVAKTIICFALVIVGAMMMHNAVKIDWGDMSEALPAFLIAIGIPFTYSIADGLALGFAAYPVMKILCGRHREVHWILYVMFVIILAYFALARIHLG